MTAQGTRKGEPSLRSMRNGLRPQPARLVRGSSRRIMSMRFKPANIRVINRRESSSLSSALLSEQPTLKAHQQERVPATPPVEDAACQTGAHSARVRYAAPQTGAPLPAPRRSGPVIYTTGGSGGNTSALLSTPEKRKDRFPSYRRKTGLTSGVNQSGVRDA